MASFTRSAWQIVCCAVLFIALAPAPVRALYFYMDNNVNKCFFEELPKDTLVVGHYSVDHWSDLTKNYIADSEIQLLITVDEIFDNDHRVYSLKGSQKGKFTFTAADAGDHKICFQPMGGVSTHGSWLVGGTHKGAVRVTLDLAIGETSQIESSDKGRLGDITQKVRDLNSRLTDIKREQIFQREREAEFRDQSETTNARVVRWTLLQLAVLGITCAWQLSHLRAFFIKQKLT